MGEGEAVVTGMIVHGESGERYPWSPITIAQLLERTADTYGGREAIICGSRRLTWRDARSAARKLAGGLHEQGVTRGDRLAVWVPNRLEWVLMWLAASYIGAVIVPVNTRYKPEEAGYIIRQSEAKALVAVESFLGIDYLEMLSRLFPQLGAAASPNEAEFPDLERIFVIGDAPTGTQSFDRLIAAGEDVGGEVIDRLAAAVDPEDPTIIVYTSGTTGHPKGAVHSHRVLRNEHSIAERMAIDSDSRVMNHMPFFHVAGAFTGLLPPLITGGAAILMDRWEPREALEIIQREGATVFSGIPTHFIDLLNHPELEKFDTSSLQTGWIGGANNPPEVIEGIIDRLGMNGILPVYGMTETTSITTIPKLEDPPAVIHSGKGLPVSDFELCVVGPDGDALPPGEEGEVCVRGHLLMKGYYRMPDATAAVIDSAGWFHTGDLGVLDAGGYLSITGRKSDMFIVGGSNAYPAEIEIALMEHPAIKQAYVVGVADPRLGEVGFAFVEAVAGEAIDETTVVGFCRARLADYKVPRAVEIVRDWPLTATGKIQRFALREMAEARRQEGR